MPKTTQALLAKLEVVCSFAECKRFVNADAVKINGVVATLDDLKKELKVGDVVEIATPRWKETITVTQDMIW